MTDVPEILSEAGGMPEAGIEPGTLRQKNV
jgi:hypothetical protein